MMGLSQIKTCLILVVCLSIFTALSASTSISDVIFRPQVLSERRLLQVLKPCPVDFENQNYTVITSKCKAPNYPIKPCCSGLKEFACPFVDELDDSSNDCAYKMFSYIRIIGKYPPGLFSSMCREGKQGLACPAPPPSSSPVVKDDKNSGSKIITCQMLVVLMMVTVATTTTLVLLLQFV